LTSKATYRFDDDALQALQASLASYLGHVRHAASYRLIVGILEQHPWLRVFFAIDHQRRMAPWFHQMACGACVRPHAGRSATFRCRNCRAGWAAGSRAGARWY